MTHSCAITPGGSVACWGSNARGQCGQEGGHEGEQARIQPTLVPGVSGALSISAGTDHSCALNDRGAALCWGDNGGGELGVETPAMSAAAVSVLSGTQFTALSTGMDGSCAIADELGVLCWGAPDHFFPHDVRRWRPERVAAELVQISSGGDHSCGVDSRGGVFCWGGNHSGQIGTGSTSQTSPVSPVRGLPVATQVAVAGGVSCALGTDRRVRCWGSNSHMEAGRDDRRNVLTPNLIALRDVVQIDAGQMNVCARLADGGVWCWGSNQYGQLAREPLEPSAQPVRILGMPAAIDVSIGHQGHACAASETAVHCWGLNDFAALGADDSHRIEARPAKSPHVTAVAALAASVTTSCGLNHEGDVVCWNDNETPARSYVIANLRKTSHLALGSRLGCAIADGRGSCWGDAYWGGRELRIDDPKHSALPVPGLPGDLSSIAASDMRVCAAESGGQVWCWGGASPAEGGAAEGFGPVRIPNASSARSVVMSRGVGCSLDFDGSVRCWPLPNTSEVHAAKRVPGVAQTRALAAGANSMCAATDGKLWCWDRALAPRQQPGPAETLVALAVGQDHRCGVSLGGRVWCWGDNAKGQLGSGQVGGHSSGWVAGLDSATAVAAGGDHSCAATRTSGVWCWGAGDPAGVGPGSLVLEPTTVRLPEAF
jgi:alpha-tubulin suppressor-like RCC1 family protein